MNYYYSLTLKSTEQKKNGIGASDISVAIMFYFSFHFVLFGFIVSLFSYNTEIFFIANSAISIIVPLIYWITQSFKYLKIVDKYSVFSAQILSGFSSFFMFLFALYIFRFLLS